MMPSIFVNFDDGLKLLKLEYVSEEIGSNESNVDVPSGVYIYQLTHNVGTITKKMILLR